MTEFLLGLLGEYNLDTILAALLAVPAVLALGVLLTVVIGLMRGKRISGAVAASVTIVCAAAFLISLGMQLYVPEVYHQHYRAKYIGTPDPACRVFVSDDDAAREPVLDDNGQPVLDENGKPVTRRVKVNYKLLGRPAGPETLMRREYHFWLSSPEAYPEGSHLCVLPMTQQNRQFAEQAQQVWDQVNGTEPEEQGQGQQGQQGQQGSGGQSSQNGQNGGQKPDIIVTLPGGEDGGEDGDGSAEQQGQNGEQGEGENSSHGLQDSQGSITLQVPQNNLTPKD